MAFGTGSSFGANVKQFSFKIKSKGVPSPYFEVKSKQDGKWIQLAESATRVSGHLIGIQHKENPYDGKMIKSVNLTIQDGNDVYFVSVGYGYLGRGLLNNLLSLKTFDDIEISLYKSKPKGDKDGFHTASLRQHGETVKWKFEQKDLPVITKVKIKGEMVGDTEAIDAFYEAQVKELSKVVRDAAPRQPASTTSTESAPDSDAGEDGPADASTEGSTADDQTPPF